ncbi:hypothetical protein Agub_g1028 [Astrephomene gubernaculifera]|uniref:Uncharacterized protein n=1 Tax=Astrephomene gubernaculifera TaxID=47775 RepID=A0AAD3DF51_9CHLO|nr:hypothetical protein Agub_g1028 [Astrephomene gubernaculifera]
MLRVWGSFARRLESLRPSGANFRSASRQHDEGTEVAAAAVVSRTGGEATTSYDLAANRQAGSEAADWWPLQSVTICSPPAQQDDSLMASTSSPTSSPSKSSRGPLQLSAGGVAFPPHPGMRARQPPSWMTVAMVGSTSQVAFEASALQQSSIQQVRCAASSSKAKSAGGRGGAAAATEAKPPRVNTPEWARMPAQLEDLQELFRRRKARLFKMRDQLQAEAAEAERGGWSKTAQRDAALAAAAALPVPPADGGVAELAAATAASTPFEAALATMSDMLRRGVVLDSESHLAPLLRKAGSEAQLQAGLEVLRRNHLVQAAARLGAHGAAQGGLHAVLVQECQRVGSAAPLVALWDSLYEHGMEPGAAAAVAAVRAAVALRDGRAAATLLALTCQYSAEPLAAGEATPVLALLESGNAEEAATLRNLLPQLGIRM